MKHTTYECDQCRRKCGDAYWLRDWLQVGDLNVAPPSAQAHLCSSACLAAWAVAHEAILARQSAYRESAAKQSTQGEANE